MNEIYRLDELTEALDKMKINRLDVLVTGDTSAGKSSTLNTILERMSAKVGEGVEPETKDVTSYSLNDKLYFWDTPGFGDGVENDKKHAKKITELLNKFYGERAKIGYIDLVLVIIDGSKRDMGTTYQMLTDVILPSFPKERVLVAINQSDIAMKGRHWNGEENAPDDELLAFLREKSTSVKRRIKEATGIEVNDPVCFSAKYDYNTSGLLDLIFDNLPKRRRLFQATNPTADNKDEQASKRKPLDIEKVVVSAFEKYFNRETDINSKSIFLKGHRSRITDKTIAKVIDNVSQCSADERDILLLVDSTFRSGNRGLIITKEKVYYKSDKDSGWIWLKDIDGIYTERKFFGNIVDIRDKDDNWYHLGQVTALKDCLEALDEGFCKVIKAVKQAREG